MLNYILVSYIYIYITIVSLLVIRIRVIIQVPLPQCSDRDLYVDQTGGAIHQFLTRRQVIQEEAAKVPWDPIGKSWKFHDEPMD